MLHLLKKLWSSDFDSPLPSSSQGTLRQSEFGSESSTQKGISTGAESGTSVSEQVLLSAVDQSIIETIQTFVRYRPGFHGDTGIRDYLYYRLMSNLPSGGKYTRADGGGTLLAQAEWYTSLKYRKTGETASRGRFDLGVPHPAQLEQHRPTALLAIECGRNKKAAGLVRDIDAVAEHEGPEPADISKLAREVLHAAMPFGYALEFYDRDDGQARELIGRLEKAAVLSAGLRVAILVCPTDRPPVLTLLPKAWESQLRQRFAAELNDVNSLLCTSDRTSVRQLPSNSPGGTNRVRKERFLSACSSDARDLIETVERKFGRRVKLVFGSSSMTINRSPSGKLLRISLRDDLISELADEVAERLAVFGGDLGLGSDHTISAMPQFRDALLAALDDLL